MALFLGIDGGQSSTTVLLADEHGNVLGAARGGPCNHVAADQAEQKFLRVMRECIEEACAQAGIALSGAAIESACCGMSGGPEDKAALLRGLIRATNLHVTSDAVVALAGAFDGGPGIVVIAGTGSISLGRGADGKLVRAGGWGYIFGDEGGAFDIVRQATRAVVRHEEGWGPATLLSEELIKATGTASANAILHLFYTPEWPRWRVAKFAKLVDAAADGGDGVACEIIDRAAQQLFDLAAAVRAQTFSEGSVYRISTVGGVFQSVRLRRRFIELTERAGAVYTPPASPPAVGALLLAYRASGITNLVKLKDSEHAKTIDSGS